MTNDRDLDKEQLQEEKSDSNGSGGSKFSWKWTGLIALLIILVGGYLLMKVNPPIEVTTIVSNEDNTSVVIGVGNTGFSAIMLKEVSVNNGDNPPKAKLQVTNPVQGFIVTEDFDSAEEGYRFLNLDGEYIKTGTTFTESYDDETPVEEIDMFGVSINHDEPIHTVQIKYSHFGISYEETVEIAGN